MVNGKTILNYFISLLPNFCWPLKKIITKKRFKKIGNNAVFFSATSEFLNPENVEIGNDVFINSGFYCSIEKRLIIKDRVMFGANVSIIGGDHLFFDPKVNMRFCKKLGNNFDIIIEEDAWIGHGCTILKNAYISEGCIIGANSLINSRLKPYSVYFGNPAKFIKPRFKHFEDLNNYIEMMKREYSFTTNYSIEELKSIYL